MIRFFPTIFLSFVFVACQFKDTGQKPPGEIHIVTRVVDGDTFWVDNGSAKGEKVRLIGVDAPETRRSAKKEIGYFGEEAKKFITELILNKPIFLAYDISRKDRYGRTLAYVFLEDGTFLNAHLVEQGYATVLTVPPNVKYADLFVKLQKKARNKKRGLWKSSSFSS